MRRDLRIEDLGDLVEQPIIAILATRRPDDSILLSPVWFDYRDGGFSIWATSMEEGKVRHIRQDPRVNLVVANADWPYKGVEIRTQARLTTDGFYDVLRRTADRYLGPGSGDEMAPRYEPGVVIRVEPGVVRAWDYTDEV